MFQIEEEKPYKNWLNARGRFSLPISLLILVLGIMLGMSVSMLYKSKDTNFVLIMIFIFGLMAAVYSAVFLLIERSLIDTFLGIDSLQPMLLRRIIALIALDFAVLWLFGGDQTNQTLTLLERYWYLHINLHFFLSFYLPIIIYIATASYVEMQVMPKQKRTNALDDFR